MTVVDQTQARERESRPAQHEPSRQINVGGSERAVSVAAGSVLAAFGLMRGSLPGVVMAGVGAALLHRGVTGHSYSYAALGKNTAEPEQEIARRGIHVEQSMLINKSPEELYRFWRNFENLPGIMHHLESVRVLDDRRSHWVTKAPRLAGGSVEWDAEITRDEPNSVIAWRSLPGSQIDTVGEIRFSKAPGDRGTEVHVSMEYVPPAGRIGHWAATLVGESPRRQMHEDLRSFKRLMETGEIITIAGQPRGTCTGTGERERE